MCLWIAVVAGTSPFAHPPATIVQRQCLVDLYSASSIFPDIRMRAVGRSVFPRKITTTSFPERFSNIQENFFPPYILQRGLYMIPQVWIFETGTVKYNSCRNPVQHLCGTAIAWMIVKYALLPNHDRRRLFPLFFFGENPQQSSVSTAEGGRFLPAERVVVRCSFLFFIKRCLPQRNRTARI